MTFISAIILGLLASLHCAGMCGGLQAAVMHTRVIRSRRQNQRHLLLLNLGRISTYVLLGCLLSLIGTQFAVRLNWPEWANWLRVATGVLLILIAVQLLFNKSKPFAFLEKYAYRLWAKIQPKADPNTAIKYHHSLRLGLIWGLLPCGLVYGVLLSASLQSSVIGGAMIMLGFGLGTLPAMLLTGVAFMQLRKILTLRSVQTAGGLVFLIAGVLILIAPYVIDHAYLQRHPLLFNSVFCISPS